MLGMFLMVSELLDVAFVTTAGKILQLLYVGMSSAKRVLTYISETTLLTLASYRYSTASMSGLCEAI